MPTWRNDLSYAVRVKNTSNVWVDVPPNASVQSYYDYTELGLTKTSELPYHNPTLSWNALHFASPGTQVVDVDSGTIKGLEVFNRSTYSGESTCSGEVWVHFNHTSGERVGLLTSGRSMSFTEGDVYRKVGKIIFVAFGKTSVDCWAKK